MDGCGGRRESIIRRSFKTITRAQTRNFRVGKTRSPLMLRSRGSPLKSVPINFRPHVLSCSIINYRARARAQTLARCIKIAKKSIAQTHTYTQCTMAQTSCAPLARKSQSLRMLVIWQHTHGSSLAR